MFSFTKTLLVKFFLPLVVLGLVLTGCGTNSSEESPKPIVNKVPVITSKAEVRVAENQNSAITIVAKDEDNGDITYSISGGDSKMFTIDEKTGVVIFKDTPDFEQKSQYKFTATAKDSVDSVSQEIIINIIDVDEEEAKEPEKPVEEPTVIEEPKEPVVITNNKPVFTSLDTQEVLENQNFAIKLTATDTDSDSLKFSISGTDKDAFSVDENSGDVTFVNLPDFERNSEYNFTAIVSDGKDSTSQEVKIIISDEEETVVTDVRSINTLGTKNSKYTQDNAELTISFAAYDSADVFISESIPKDEIKIENLKVEKVTTTRSISRAQTSTLSADVISNNFINNTKLLKNIVIDIDSTGSMEDNDPDKKRLEAAKKFIDLQREADDTIAIVDFDYKTTTQIDFTNDDTALKAAIDQVDSWGGTYMNTSLNYVIDNMLKNRVGSRQIVILTDGETFDKNLHEGVIKNSKDNSVTIYTIALGDDIDDLSYLQELADKTGGIFAKISDPDGLDKIYKNFAVASIKGSQNVTIKVPLSSKNFAVGDKVKISGTINVNSASSNFEKVDVIK